MRYKITSIYIILVYILTYSHLETPSGVNKLVLSAYTDRLLLEFKSLKVRVIKNFLQRFSTTLKRPLIQLRPPPR